MKIHRRVEGCALEAWSHESKEDIVRGGEGENEGKSLYNLYAHLAEATVAPASQASAVPSPAVGVCRSSYRQDVPAQLHGVPSGRRLEGNLLT